MEIVPGGLCLSRFRVNPALLAALLSIVLAAIGHSDRAWSSTTSDQPTPPRPIDVNDPATADIFAGRVVDTQGQPVAGAKVYVVPKDVWTQPVDVRAVTGADGRFRFSARDLTYIALDGLPARIGGLLSASAEGYGPDVVATPGRTPLNLGMGYPTNKSLETGQEWTLTLSRGEVPILGRLLDPAGQPLAGATVSVSDIQVPNRWDLDQYLACLANPDRMQQFERTFYIGSICPGVTTPVVTGPDGRFRIDGVGRDRLVTLDIKGPGIVNELIDVMTREVPDVRLHPQFNTPRQILHGANFTYASKPGRTFHGVVRDRTTGQPLADVVVGYNQLTKTDAEGRFTVGGYPTKGKIYDDVVLPRPGQPYLPTKLILNPDGETVVECRRGVPYRLTLRDEAGRIVEADEVGCVAIAPNEVLMRDYRDVLAVGVPSLNKAARQPDGSYLGVAVPGPGAVVAKTPERAGYRPAHVDPKAFFAPGQTEWSAQELFNAYGTDDTLSSPNCWHDQHDYAAIVLINPAEGSNPLELEATVVRDRPRQVTLLDPEGNPVVGARSGGLRYYDHYGNDSQLRSATFPITGLHPDRVRRIWFTKEDRKLIGSLMARGDGDAPYTVRMQPWAAIYGRFVDDNGVPILNERKAGPRMHLEGVLNGDSWFNETSRKDPKIGRLPYAKVDDDGRFRIEPLIPGQQYFGYLGQGLGRPSRAAFEGLVLEPGQVVDVGDIRLVAPIKPKAAAGNR